MTKGHPPPEVMDLCSDGDATPTERQSKRHRKEFDHQDLLHKQQGAVVDLSAESPEDTGPSGSGRSDHRLWGEVDGPPRWNHARRRSALRPSPELLNPDVVSMSSHAPSWPAPPTRITRFGQRGEEPPAPPPSRGFRHVRPHRRVGTDPVALSDEEPTARSRANVDAAIARRLQEREDAIATRRAAEATARELEAEDLVRRMDELDEMEAMEVDFFNHPGMGWGPPGAAHLPQPDQQSGQPPQSRPGVRRPGGWVPASLAEAMMGMLSEGGPLAHMQLGSLTHHMAAVRNALGNMSGSGRLPAHLLFSDRDFDENDYEALLALDDNIKSRKGATEEQIDLIPTVVVGFRGVKAEEDARCPICLEDLMPGSVLRRLSCKHHFHKACVDRWLSQKACCPICQQNSCN